MAHGRAYPLQGRLEASREAGLALRYTARPAAPGFPPLSLRMAPCCLSRCYHPLRTRQRLTRRRTRRRPLRWRRCRMVPSAAAAAEAVMPAAAGEASAAAREAAATQNLLRDLGVAAGGETASKPPRAPMTEAEAALVIQRQLRMRTAKRHVRARAKRKAVRDAILAVEAATHHQPPRRRRHGAAQASGGEAPKHDARRRRHARGATEAAEGQQAGAKHGAAGAWESEQACAALRVRHAAAEAEVAALRGATEERQAEERDGAVARRRAQREQAKAQRGAAGEWEAARAEAAAVERACAALRVRRCGCGTRR